MADQICDTKIRKGVGVVVSNQEPVFGAAPRYVNFYLDFPTGGRCAMFTEREAANLFSRPEVLTGWAPPRGKLCHAHLGGHPCWVVNLELAGVVKTVRLGVPLLNAALARAAKNPEDVTKPSWLLRVFG